MSRTNGWVSDSGHKLIGGFRLELVRATDPSGTSSGWHFTLFSDGEVIHSTFFNGVNNEDATRLAKRAFDERVSKTSDTYNRVLKMLRGLRIEGIELDTVLGMAPVFHVKPEVLENVVRGMLNSGIVENQEGILRLSSTRKSFLAQASKRSQVHAATTLTRANGQTLVRTNGYT